MIADKLAQVDDDTIVEDSFDFELDDIVELHGTGRLVCIEFLLPMNIL